jgi:hypothetical protein
LFIKVLKMDEAVNTTKEEKAAQESGDLLDKRCISGCRSFLCSPP